MAMAPIKTTRKLFQVFFLTAAAVLAVKLMLGMPTRTVESYCPMGGVVSLYGLIRKQQFICALSEMNLSLALALFGAVLLTRRSFCSWVCPLGTVFEGLSWVRSKIMRRATLRLSDRADAVLSRLKYVVLGIILLLTYQASELVFRGYDPFYILFTGGRGHGLVPVVSIGLLAGVLGLSFIYELAWCRYMCPLAAVMDPLARIGLVKVRRDSERCDSCGLCDRVCPQRIPVSERPKVTRSDCTNCLECVVRCSRSGALGLGL
jgi:polyferredoxin